jgi:hypothetical protein
MSMPNLSSNVIAMKNVTILQSNIPLENLSSSNATYHPLVLLLSLKIDMILKITIGSKFNSNIS